MRERRAYVVLFGLSVLLSVIVVLYQNRQLQNNNHKFCQIVVAATQTVVPKPADPTSNPSREQAYEWYQRYLTLRYSLGC